MLVKILPGVQAHTVLNFAQETVKTITPKHCTTLKISLQTWQGHSVIAGCCSVLKICHQICLLQDEVSKVHIVLRLD